MREGAAREAGRCTEECGRCWSMMKEKEDKKYRSGKATMKLELCLVARQDGSLHSSLRRTTSCVRVANRHSKIVRLDIVSGLELITRMLDPSVGTMKWQQSRTCKSDLEAAMPGSVLNGCVVATKEGEEQWGDY